MKELMVMAFVLSAPSTSHAGMEGDAYTAIMNASYKASGLEAMMSAYGEKQLKKVPKELQVIGGDIYLVGKIVQERKVTVNWSF